MCIGFFLLYDRQVSFSDRDRQRISNFKVGFTGGGIFFAVIAILLFVLGRRGSNLLDRTTGAIQTVAE